MKVGLFYTTGNINGNLLAASLESIKKAADKTRNVRLICSSLNNEIKELVEAYGFEFRFYGNVEPNKRTMTAQLFSLVSGLDKEDIVFFLEHDVLYAENYFELNEYIFESHNYVVRRFIQLSPQGFQVCPHPFNPLFAIVTKAGLYKYFLGTALQELAGKDDVCLEPNAKYFKDNSTTACHVTHTKHYTNFFIGKAQVDIHFGGFNKYENLINGLL
jgi:hypothetical protein